MTEDIMSLDDFLRVLEHDLAVDRQDLAGETPFVGGPVFDSLDVIDIIMIIEDLGVNVNEEDIPSLETLAELYEYYRERASASA